MPNIHLKGERLALYQALCQRLCQHLPQPWILVDWSDIVEQQRLLLIRAALVVEGRALPLYEAVYPLKHYNTPTTHARFLRELKELLPAHCRPIIITDAGFRGPWFAAVEKLGWHWIGRVRNCINYRLKSHSTWKNTTELYERANARPCGTLQQTPLRSPIPEISVCFLQAARVHYKGFSLIPDTVVETWLDLAREQSPIKE